MATERMGQDWAEVLSEVPLFADLSKRHLKKIAGLATTRRFARYSRIVHAGDRGDAFYVILDGAAAVRRPGKRDVKLGPGDGFGELALLDGSPRTATVEAQADVLAMRLSRPAFMKMLEREPKVAVALLRTLSQRLRDTDSSPSQ
jgi:CRP/FNR family transcriptional regulator, cyclic AMP receptor protein